MGVLQNAGNDGSSPTGRRRRTSLNNVGHKTVGRKMNTAKLLRNAVLCYSTLIALSTLTYTTIVRAQQIGVDVCGCSPMTFSFTLDLSLTCPPTNITAGGGVAAVSCLVSPFGAPTDDLTPIVIESISVLELDQSNSVLVEERIDGNLLNGETFTYTSILNNPAFIPTSEQIPKAIQMNLNGRNVEGVILLNVFIITYSNECGFVPVIKDEHSAGWVIFVGAL